MARITELTLRDVRCFAARQTARLGRITVLVGPNSTGKSTFLGCYHVFSILSAMWELNDRNYFDDEFQMGAFDTIARSGAPAFSLAGRFENHCHTGARFTFEPDADGSPLERRVELEFPGATGGQPASLTISRLPDALRAWEFQGPGFEFRVDRAEVSYTAMSTWLSRSARHGHLPFGGEPTRFRKRGRSAPSAAEQASFARFASFFGSVLPLPGNRPFVAVAGSPELPSRQREYRSPPRYFDTMDAAFLSYFETIGEMLGLWTAISLEPASAGPGVQVMVHKAGQRHNLVDVGYGVHSLLPLIHDLYEQRNQSDAVLLLQQPEIHVHPAAQAALADYLARCGCAFVVETHSQHLVDRLRICRTNGVLGPDELSIVYFEPQRDNTVTIHNIGVDPHANLVGAPQGYGRFFVTETERLLGLSE